MYRDVRILGRCDNLGTLTIEIKMYKNDQHDQAYSSSWFNFANWIPTQTRDAPRSLKRLVLLTYLTDFPGRPTRNEEIFQELENSLASVDSTLSDLADKYQTSEPDSSHSQSFAVVVKSSRERFSDEGRSLFMRAFPRLRDQGVLEID